jgi:hypothetical protein
MDTKEPEKNAFEAFLPEQDAAFFKGNPDSFFIDRQEIPKKRPWRSLSSLAPVMPFEV